MYDPEQRRCKATCFVNIHILVEYEQAFTYSHTYMHTPIVEVYFFFGELVDLAGSILNADQELPYCTGSCPILVIQSARLASDKYFEVMGMVPTAQITKTKGGCLTSICPSCLVVSKTLRIQLTVAGTGSGTASADWWPHCSLVSANDRLSVE